VTRRRLAFLVVVGLGLVLAVLVAAALLTSDTGPRSARRDRAQLQCKSLAHAIEAYQANPASGGKYPESLQQLLTPPFGGTLLKNGEDDLKDPWGRPYELRYVSGPDGTKLPLVYTTTPDGTTVSQYGSGPKSRLE